MLPTWQALLLLPGQHCHCSGPRQPHPAGELGQLRVEQPGAPAVWPPLSGVTAFPRCPAACHRGGVALGTVTGLEIEAPVLPAWVSPGASLNLNFSARRIGMTFMIGWHPGSPVCLSLRPRSSLSLWSSTQSSSLAWGCAQLSGWPQNTTWATQLPPAPTWARPGTQNLQTAVV